MKILGIIFGWKAKDTYRFLVIDTTEITDYYRTITPRVYHRANGFDTEKKAMEYIDEYIPKAHRERIKIYKEIPLTKTKI